MSIVTKLDFQGEIVIANKSDVATTENINWFINKYEPKFLQALLGVDFAKLFTDGRAVDPIDQRWTDLLTPNGYDLKTAIASFIYYWYMRNENKQTVVLGTVKAKAQSATIDTAADKVDRAWSEMVQICWQTVRYLKDNPTIYPEFVVPSWFSSFYLQWTTWSYAADIFCTGLFYQFCAYRQIPGIFKPLPKI